MATFETFEAPEFSGMSPEAFMGGHDVAASYARLEPGVRLESARAVLGAIGYNIPLAEATPEQLDEIAEEARKIADRAAIQKVNLERQREREANPSHYDDY